MTNSEQLSGALNDLRGRVQQKWGEVADDDWARLQGSVDRLVGYLQKRTGETREQIERTLSSWSQGASGLMDEARAQASSLAEHAAACAHDTASNVGEAFDLGRQRAEQVVQRRPVESLIIALGLGVLIGVIAGAVGRAK